MINTLPSQQGLLYSPSQVAANSLHTVTGTKRGKVGKQSAPKPCDTWAVRLLLTNLYSGTRDGCFSSAMLCLSKSQRNDVWWSHLRFVIACAFPPNFCSPKV